ncbi:hypothetical protein [Streptosporangium lutulentum]|uniref:WD40-like Beta Propeller Repeat n=1 Tax=Streptosporangium lutulentum TaxID=1461250 RepID=A0ABT9QNP3_9ACTN|nr:hypothetical protein [Streptosporangium lutulentum]MDP9848381.1 hypothetical protein [Streptosporangium lutulentum]
MNLLRDELHGIADEVPQIDLAERAIRGARRRRAGAMALAVATAVAVVTCGTTILVNGAPRTERSVVFTTVPEAVPAVPEVVPALPKKGVGPLVRAYSSPCRFSIDTSKACVGGRWWVSTSSGATYELTEAMGLALADSKRVIGPVTITQDGRRIAYYSEKQRAIEVRDLASGRIWKAPFKIGDGDLDGNHVLRLSPDGLHLIHTSWNNGSKWSSVLVDMETGRTTTLGADWFPLSVGDGGSPVTLTKRRGKTTQIWVLGNKPITIKDSVYQFSALGPDGRTLVRLGAASGRTTGPFSRKIIVLDAVDGGGRPVPVKDIPEEQSLRDLGAWVSDTEVALRTVPGSSEPGLTPKLYAVNVHTGKARELRKIGFQDLAVLPEMLR